MTSHVVGTRGLRQRCPFNVTDAQSSSGCDQGDAVPICRLFALYAGIDDVDATFWLLDAPASLAEQSHANPDGFGLATLNSAAEFELSVVERPCDQCVGLDGRPRQFGRLRTTCSVRLRFRRRSEVGVRGTVSVTGDLA